MQCGAMLMGLGVVVHGVMQCAASSIEVLVGSSMCLPWFHGAPIPMGLAHFPNCTDSDVTIIGCVRQGIAPTRYMHTCGQRCFLVLGAWTSCEHTPILSEF